MLRRPIPRLLALAGICWLAITPFFVWGSPSGHDFEFHMCSWMDVVSQWRQGILYPRWAALAHWGYGEARFVFYPPASWTLGAVLGSVLPWKMVPGAFCWIALTLAGAAMYALARQWLAPADAMFAAVFYAMNPYHLLIIYWRSAYAELLAASLVPLLLLFLLQLRESGFRPVLFLSLTLAGAWLSNVPAAVMIHYSAVGLALLISLREKSLRPLLRTAVAIVLAAGLASFYLVPAIYEQRWVNIDEVLSPGVRPQDNFLFTPFPDPDHNRFNLLLSYLALSEIAALALAVWSSRRKQSDKSVWLLFSAWGTATAFLMLSASNLLWGHLPKLRFVQLPFRWLLCMNAALAILFSLATARITAPHSAGTHFSIPDSTMARWTARALACAVLLAVLILAARRTQPPWWETAADVADISQSVSDGSGYEGTDEYVPAGADPYELQKSLPLVSDESANAVDVRMLKWGAIEKHFLLHSSAAQNLTMHLFNYPAWKVTVNGKRVETQTADVTSLMIIPVSAGENDVRIHFTRTPDRRAADVISLISFIVFAAAWWKTGSHNAGSRDASPPNRTSMASSDKTMVRPS